VHYQKRISNFEQKPILLGGGREGGKGRVCM
jgi:hypothetical protein